MEGIFDYRPPQPLLRDYVRMLKIVGCSFPASMTSLPVKAYWPRAENCLSFYPKDPERQQFGYTEATVIKPRSIVNGQYSMVTNRHVGRDFMVFQVQFQPGALYRLTGLPSGELTNAFVDAEAVFSSEMNRVDERLSYCRHYTEMITVVEDFLLYLVSRARHPHLHPIDRATRYLLERPGSVSLDWLADQACLSQWQFYRCFVDREGVSPKFYARIARFEQAMKLKNTCPDKDWLSVALELGYHDYQHLVRDFREFTTLTPNAFLLRDGRSPERTFGVAET
ncbi:helix-turn-helix domain-containing protein [Rudanella paleaurantiibacter]|uniref:Helix-turn-helix domain-containing protein n=1 Tax=Rudanella paleaurantiibacter TaxID=2614655 RepID=A0A7J5U028_9BACT|nr:AraC family transcriptional regulator [Rudanella paleaurantiibacter]KAB7731019.1 helix-turn-helix domain-containing protein [Rudanella paleaurantiibacter]